MALDFLERGRVMGLNNNDPFSELSSHNYLFERLDRDIRAVRKSIEVLNLTLRYEMKAFEEALASFKNGWLAISLCYDVLAE